MNILRDSTPQNPYKYFVLTFLISWILWSPLYFSEEVNEFWVLPGAWGPTIAAILITYINKGKIGVKKLLGKLLIWKVHFKYYFFAIFGILIIGLLSIMIYKIVGGELPDFTIILEGMGLQKGDLNLALLLLPVYFLVNTLFGGPIAEELGWRGYAQEMMQLKYSPNVTGLLIGFLWSIWHLPLFIFLPKAIGSIPILAYIPLMTAMGVIFSWLYNNTRGSVLLAILLHGGMNFAIGFLGVEVFSDTKLLLIHVSLIIILAIILSKRNKKPVANKV